jgi:hypothetical protein
MMPARSYDTSGRFSAQLNDRKRPAAGAGDAAVGGYFLIGVGTDDLPCAPPNGKAGAAGLVLSFFGFFTSRLLRACPLAI